jgi:transcriptional regulator GlxA family with amidase domain
LPKSITTNPLLLASSIERLGALCEWIENNSDSTIGWNDLTNHSGFTHQELIGLFKFHKQITPMAYIRKVRENKKKLLASNLQHQLFANTILKQKNE